VLIICLLFVMFFSNYISRIITKSIDLLKFKAEKIKKGDFSDSENVKTKDELKDLDDTINLMTIELRGEKAKIDKKVNEQTQELNKEKEGLDTQRKAILNILEDVDAQRNKAEELARIVDGANESIISKTLDGTVLTWNKGAENLYGFTDNEIVGKSIKMIVPEGKEEEVDAIMKSVAVGQMRDHYQTVRRRKDGSLIEVSLTASPIKNVTGKVVAISVISIDITKERAIDKAKTEFVSLASHQLRTPLSAINWYTEMLMAGDVGKVNKEQMEYLNEVYTGSQRMVELVNALLNVSRLELGTFTISLEPVNVPALVKSLIKEMKSEIDKRKEVVTELYSPNLPTLSADNSSLRMVLQNLLSNSVKYTAAGGNITVEAAVKSKGEIVDGQKINEDRFILRVADSGMGIPKGQQNKVFEKLFRADNARTLETEGTGLGLYVIKSIVDQSGGEIWFVSEENKGTTFIISYPLTGMKKVEKK
jgi:PAS domain S-box-containing protein